MNNSRNKKERARLHNLAFDEREAYKQDRREDPEKYANEMFYTGRSRSVGVIAAMSAIRELT